MNYRSAPPRLARSLIGDRAKQMKTVEMAEAVIEIGLETKSVKDER